MSEADDWAFDSSSDNYTYRGYVYSIIEWVRSKVTFARFNQSVATSSLWLQEDGARHTSVAPQHIRVPRAVSPDDDPTPISPLQRASGQADSAPDSRPLWTT